MTLIELFDSSCTSCKLHQTAKAVCEPGFGNPNASVMVVSKMPNSGQYQEALDNALIAAGLDIDDVYYASALKCRTFDQNASNKDTKTCAAEYLHREIAAVKPKWILALGNEGLLATTGHSGITNYRGRVIEAHGAKVVPTIAMAAVQRNPGQMQSWQADLTFFASQVAGRSSEVEMPKVAIINTKDKVRKLKRLLDQADLISYDIETTRAGEHEDGAAIVSLAGTVMRGDKMTVFALPLYHPESPWRRQWKSLLRHLAPHLERVPRSVAHNGKFDARWLRQFGVRMGVTFDTMLAAHLLDENRQKGLKPLARTLLGVPPWEISTRDLLGTPLSSVLKYNALDTYYTYHIYVELKRQLVEQPRLLRLFKLLIMPSNEIFIDVERRGVWIDPEKLASAYKVAFDMRDEIDRQLMEWVPDPDDPEVDWPTNSKGKPVEVNFNASNFARWWLFEHLDFPVLARGKTKDDGRPGDPSMAEDVMLELKNTGHPVIKLLLERSKWQKYCSTYVSRYIELADEDNRIHTTFKLSGTVTGRLSSGKADADKVTGGAKTNIRGVNLQQVPRDPFIRGLFGAPPGWSFVEADFSQVELRVVAFLSRDKRMLRIYQLGEDIHLATASSVLGKPMSQVTKEDRKKAKAVNFGFVYGMGAPKFVHTAFSNYELVFTLDEAREVRRAFFAQFPALLSWHARQRRLVHNHARVQSPLGRIRHLPDVNSGDQGVVAEAERQAINSPVQSFASDMNLLSMILIQQQFTERGIPGHVLGTVHDAINFEIRDDALPEALPIIKRTMETLPLKRKFGVDLDVPIVADLKVGRHWGNAREIPEQEVYNWQHQPE